MYLFSEKIFHILPFPNTNDLDSQFIFCNRVYDSESFLIYIAFSISGEMHPGFVLRLDTFLKSGDPLQYAKKLKNFSAATYRFRVGDYRIIFRPDASGEKLIVLVVLKVAHRESMY